MKSKKRLKQLFSIIFSILLLLLLGLCFVPSVFGGYTITEHSANRYSTPNQDGEVVFEKEVDNKKIVIWDTGKYSYVKQIDNPSGIFKRVTNVNVISKPTLDEKMKVRWSAIEKENAYYDTIFAIEVLDDEIEKVIVSNGKYSSKRTSLETVKEQSTVFIELDVKNGYIGHYSKLPSSDVGSFSFFGINSDGKVVSFD